MSEQQRDQARTISVSLPAELEARVRAQAEREGRPLSWLVRDLLVIGLDFRATQPAGPLSREGAA